jgi:hypothetical protein
MSFTGPLEDRVAIYELQHEYGDAATRKDMDGWLACWADEGVWEVMHGTFIGRAAIADEWTNIMENMSGALKGPNLKLFTSFPGALNIDGERAHGYVYTNELLADDDGHVTRLSGRYDDSYICRHGRWLFKIRRYSILHVESHRER